MATDGITPTPQTVPLGRLLFRALSADSSTHSTYLVYCKLCDVMQHTHVEWTHAELATALQLSRSTVTRSLRVLRGLGVITPQSKQRSVTQVLTATSNRTLVQVLQAIAKQTVKIEFATGVIRHEKSGKVWTAENECSTGDALAATSAALVTHSPNECSTGDALAATSAALVTHSSLGTDTGDAFPDAWTPTDSAVSAAPVKGYATKQAAFDGFEAVGTAKKISLPISYLESREVRSPREYQEASKYVCAESAPNPPDEPTELVPYDYSVTDRHHPAYCRITAGNLPHRSFVPARDPYRKDIETILAYANTTWKNNLSVYDRRGFANERYGHIWRALVIWGATVEQFRHAIDVVPKHHYWGKQNVRDLSKFLTKQSNWDDLVDYRAPIGQQFDRRQVHLAPDTKSPDELETVTW